MIPWSGGGHCPRRMLRGDFGALQLWVSLLLQFWVSSSRGAGAPGVVKQPWEGRGLCSHSGLSSALPEPFSIISGDEVVSSLPVLSVEQPP